MSAPRRLLAVCAVDHPGGAEVGFLRLARRLRDRGWAITLTTPGDGPLRDAALELGLAHEPLAVGGLVGGAGAGALFSWPRARRLARGFDVTYLNGGVPGRLLPALPRSARTVLHVHDMVERVPRFWRRAGVVLADSQAVADRLTGLDAHVVYCPVELDPPPVDPPWGRGDGPVVAFIGRIEPRKGPLDLAHAAPAIRAGSPRARIVIVGDDPYGHDSSYLRAVRTNEDVEHYRWVEGAAGMMGAADVLVLPSYGEPFGTVLAEAMAAGTPVVATRVDGLPEVVEDGVTGALVEPGDPAGLAAAVLRVLERRDELGAAARESARRFDADLYADRVEGLITP